MLLVFWGGFLLVYFVYPGNSNYCYWGIVECIFSCMYFCENINIEKKMELSSSRLKNFRRELAISEKSKKNISFQT